LKNLNQYVWLLIPVHNFDATAVEQHRSEVLNRVDTLMLFGLRELVGGGRRSEDRDPDGRSRLPALCEQRWRDGNQQ
jgi:hypothetical protein